MNLRIKVKNLDSIKLQAKIENHWKRELNSLLQEEKVFLYSLKKQNKANINHIKQK